MNNASRGYCLSTIRGHIENNLNNFYNKLQRSRGHRLFDAYADQGLLVAKQQYTTLRQDNQ